jgi:hypothetical protein
VGKGKMEGFISEYQTGLDLSQSDLREETEKKRESCLIERMMKSVGEDKV